MTKHMKLTGFFTSTLAAGALAAGICTAPAANAVAPCAQGYHLQAGTCTVNEPGPYARMDAANPQCWFTSEGQKFCYPGADVFK